MGKTIHYYCNECMEFTERPPWGCLKKGHSVFVELKPGYKAGSEYICNLCGEIFDTSTGKGKMHMAGHGFNLKFSIETGKCRKL